MSLCPLCDSEKLLEGAWNRYGSPQWLCGDCGWQFAVPKKREKRLSTESQNLIEKINRSRKSPSKGKKNAAGLPGNSQEATLTSYAKMLSFVMLVACIPVLNWPLDALEIFFHELSHGMAALAIGEEIKRVEVGLSFGWILTTETGHFRVLVGWAGYAGTVFWGVWMYRIGHLSSLKRCFFQVLFVILLISLCTIFWVRSSDSLLVLFWVYNLLALSLGDDQTKPGPAHEPNPQIYRPLHHLQIPGSPVLSAPGPKYRRCWGVGGGNGHWRLFLDLSVGACGSEIQ